MNKPNNLPSSTIEKALANAKASLEIEGLYLPDDVTEVIRRNLKGELSEEDVLSYIRNKGLVNNG